MISQPDSHNAAAPSSGRRPSVLAKIGRVLASGGLSLVLDSDDRPRSANASSTGSR